VSPTEATNPVKTQHTFTANVKRADGTPAADTEVQWLLNRFPAAVGDIVEGSSINKLDNTFAKTLTDANGNAKIVITATREGDTDVTAFVPAITDASKHKVYATKHWVDMLVDFPPNGVDKVGTQHVFAAKVYRASNGLPLKGVEVRWTTSKNDPASYYQGFGANSTSAVTTTDAMGMVSTTLMQVSPIVGENLLRVDVMSPDGIRLYSKDVSQKWVAPTLNVTKTGPASADINTDFAFTIRVRNDGAVGATNVTATDIIPDGLTYLSSNPTGLVAGQSITWSLGSLAAGQSLDIVANFRGVKNGQWTNRVSVNSAEGMKAEATAAVTITGDAKLGITKTGPATVAKGDVLRYTINVSNTGKVATTNTVVTDAIPEGLTYIQSYPWAATVSGNTASWDLLSIPAGESRSLWVEFNVVASSGTIKNTARVTATGTAPAEASAITEIKKSGVSVTKTGPTNITLDTAAQYTITVRNNGDIALTNVTVTDTLPTQLQHVNSDPGPIVSGATLSWNVPVLNVGDSKVFVVNTRAVAIGTFDNVVNVSSAQGATATARASGNVTSYSVSVTKTGQPNYYLNSPSRFTITVTNTGKNDLNNVNVTDTLPANMTYVSSAPSATVNGKQLNWTIPLLAVGANQQFIVNCTASQIGPFDNAVNVTSAQGATASTKLSAIVTYFTGVDLSNRDTIDPVAVGSTTTYEISVNNQGGILPIHNVKVSMQIPSIGTFVSADGPSTSTVSGGIVTFNAVPELAAGKSLVFKVVVRAANAGPALSRATLVYDEFQLPVSAEQGTTFYQP
jgi:uncharacterized repeat protein (TIGR01451 family)